MRRLRRIPIAVETVRLLEGTNVLITWFLFIYSNIFDFGSLQVSLPRLAISHELDYHITTLIPNYIAEFRSYALDTRVKCLETNPDRKETAEAFFFRKTINYICN